MFTLYIVGTNLYEHPVIQSVAKSAIIVMKDMEKITNHKLFLFLKKGFIYLVFIYVLIILVRAIWINWTLKKEVDKIKADIVLLQNQNKDLNNLIVYYQSDSFRELEARQILDLKLPDETVVIVPVKKFDDYQTEINNDRKIISKSSEDNMPNWKAWWRYIFK